MTKGESTLKEQKLQLEAHEGKKIQDNSHKTEESWPGKNGVRVNFFLILD